MDKKERLEALSAELRSAGCSINVYWVFRMMTLACIYATFARLPYESACNSRGSISTKRQ
jgi:hypothetical protein